MASEEMRPEGADNLLDEDTKYAISDLGKDSGGEAPGAPTRSGLVKELRPQANPPGSAGPKEARRADRVLTGGRRYESGGETELTAAAHGHGGEATHQDDPDRMPTEEHTVVLDEDPMGKTQTVRTAPMPGPAPAAAADDLFVILPEGADGSIPMVETEAFEDGVTEIVEDSDVFGGPESAAETGLTSRIDFDPAEAPTGELTEFVEPHDSFDELTDLEGGEPTEMLGDDFDDLAMSLDDEDLLADRGRAKSLPGSEKWEEDDFGEDAERSRSVAGTFARVVLTVAALAVVGLSAYYYFVDPQLFGLLGERRTAVASTGPVTSPGSADPSLPGEILPGQDAAGGATASGPGTGPGAGPAAGEVEEYRQLLRSKVLLSLRLGFTGEVAYE